MSIPVSNDFISSRYTFQGGYVNLYVPSGRSPVAPTKRGKVVGFSKKSRKRLLDMTAKLLENKSLFITLTYGQSFPDCMTAKRHLQTWLKRVKRAFDGSCGFWRLELQQRGAPHFHVVLFSEFIDKSWIAKTWFEVIGDEFSDLSSGSPRAPFTRIEKINNRKHLRRYVSKYVAKVSSLEEAPDSVAIGGGFNTLPYLTVGRVWGIFNRDFLPFAPCHVVENTVINKAWWDVKRLARRVWRGVNRGNAGFTLYVTDSYKWFSYLIYLSPPIHTISITPCLP